MFFKKFHPQTKKELYLNVRFWPKQLQKIKLNIAKWIGWRQWIDFQWYSTPNLADDVEKKSEKVLKVVVVVLSRLQTGVASGKWRWRRRGLSNAIPARFTVERRQRRKRCRRFTSSRVLLFLLLLLLFLFLLRQNFTHQNGNAANWTPTAQ